MFDSVQAAPPDAILGLTEAFRADHNPDKINLGVGVYQDDTGTTPVLECVKEAAKRLAESIGTKSYLPIPGAPAYGKAVQELIFGADHEIVTSRRAATSHTPGGTAALRVVGDFLKRTMPDSIVWLTNPTWANHAAVFEAAGVTTRKFPYFDAACNTLTYEQMLAALHVIPAGDAVLLQGCCHNPTGIDPTVEQWREIAGLMYARGVLPIIDFAYQGFADGIAEDTAGLHEFCRPGQEFIACTSFSKNFGLYRERVGSVNFVSANEAISETVQSQVKRAIRSNYSNPPAHGAELVVTVLEDRALRKQWEGEVTQMRNRINGIRQLFVKKLAEHGVPGDYSFITRQRGMFSFSGLRHEQVERLKLDHAIYIVNSGRINVAGITTKNVDRLAHAIAQVLEG